MALKYYERYRIRYNEKFLGKAYFSSFSRNTTEFVLHPYYIQGVSRSYSVQPSKHKATTRSGKYYVNDNTYNEDLGFLCDSLGRNQSFNYSKYRFKWDYNEMGGSSSGAGGEKSGYGSVYELEAYKDEYYDTIQAEEGILPKNGIPETPTSETNYWYIEGDYVNRLPVISGSDYDYKSVTEDFEIEYLVTDTDANDIVNVEVLTGLVGSLGEKVKEHKPIGLGMKYKYLVPAKSLPIGNYFIKIVATDKSGAKSERNYLFERVNSIPLITSTLSTKLGDKNTGFTIPYKVSDTNVDDKLSVTVRINNKTVDQKANVKHNEELYFTVTNEMLLSYELNKEVTIEIEVVDDKGASNRLIFTFTRTNALPIISDNDKDLGSFEVSPEFKFSISDTEKDEIFYSLYLDDKKLEDQLTIEDGEEKIYKFSHDDWIKIDPSKNHIFRIVATDKHAIEIAGENEPQTVERKFTFKRICNRLEVNFKIAESVEKQEGMDTSQLKGLVGRVTAMTLTPDIVVAGGAVVKYLVTNNGNDENPTWENATDSVLAGAKYFFTNETKTAEKWLYMVKVIVERNTAVENSRLKALAGSWGYNDYNM